mmetsp:Transcript_40489/g.127497  ORF Transcript_40489/g.127497 Transcript_40489/m.127497 type:complete len:206 (+) Transcript_40489:1906-2523(+)
MQSTHALDVFHRAAELDHGLLDCRDVPGDGLIEVAQHVRAGRRDRSTELKEDSMGFKVLVANMADPLQTGVLLVFLLLYQVRLSPVIVGVSPGIKSLRRARVTEHTPAHPAVMLSLIHGEWSAALVVSTDLHVALVHPVLTALGGDVPAFRIALEALCDQQMYDFLLPCQRERNLLGEPLPVEFLSGAFLPVSQELLRPILHEPL